MPKAKVPVSINGIEFDALISEDRTLEASVPEYAVEEGYSISDAIIIGAEKLNMTLYVTNTPVTWYWTHGWTTERVEGVCYYLEQLFFSAVPCTIVTSDKTYYDMAIESISFNKNVETGYSREIPISFKKIRVTTANTTSIPDSYGKSGKTEEQTGAANTATIDIVPQTVSSESSSSSLSTNTSKQSKGSILYGLAHSAGLIK